MKNVKRGMALLGFALIGTARADITPEDGQKFEPYAMSAGAMDAIAMACLETPALQQAVSDASQRLGSTLMKYGMPAAAFREDYQSSRQMVEVAIANAGTESPCTEEVLKALRGWPTSVDTTIGHLQEAASTPGPGATH